MNCPTDVGLCTGSCWNHILEDGEECDHWSDNWKDNLCDENCRDISSDKKCWNGNPDEWEECDYGEYNWESECTLQCKFVKTINCWNGKIDEWENCNICAEDLGSKCLGKCWNNEIDTWEQCDNGEENNDTDWICTATCMDVTSCGNEQIDEWENCTNCSKDLKDRCVDNTDQEKLCGNGKIDEWENCTNCSKDVWECSASCGNEIHEEPEECDKGSANWTKWSMCSLNCKNTDPEHYCWNEITEKDLGEECDLWKERNGKEGSSCAIDCKPFDKENPKCWNWEIDEWERCDNCKKDLWDLCITKCWNGIKDFGEECDPKADNGEGIICSNECKIITWNDPDDYDCDGVPNDDDLCPYNAGIAGNEACLDPGHIRDPNDNWCKDPDDIDCDWVPNDDDLCPINPGYAWDNACLDPDHVRDPDDNWCKDPDDKDCDWVPNDEDSCPELAGIAWDEACTDPNHERDPDDHGCPNNDEDCDGISDNKDLCPNVPWKAWDKACTDPNHESDPDDNGCPDDDEDCDGIQDSIANCPNISWRAWDTACKDPNHKRELDDDGCPDLPDYLCEGDDCALVTVVCNSCPCQFADYNNTLQRDDSVRARLWDKKNMVHYNYSEFYSIGNLFN